MSKKKQHFDSQIAEHMASAIDQFLTTLTNRLTNHEMNEPQHEPNWKTLVLRVNAEQFEIAVNQLADGVSEYNFYHENNEVVNDE